MTRKDFLKTTRFGIAPTLLLGANFFRTKFFSNTIKHGGSMTTAVATNHILHEADSRGNANHGWLHSRHTFSFANYYNPKRVNFGALRVLNDDIVKGGMGFGTHGHSDMKIVSIPLYGDLEHKDSTGRHEVIRTGDVQIMSVGTSIAHSEYNKNEDKEVRFLQIWVFRKKDGFEPRYEQKIFPPNAACSFSRYGFANEVQVMRRNE